VKLALFAPLSQEANIINRSSYPKRRPFGRDRFRSRPLPLLMVKSHRPDLDKKESRGQVVSGPGRSTGDAERAVRAPTSLRAADVAELQRLVGNNAITGLLRRGAKGQRFATEPTSSGQQFLQRDERESKYIPPSIRRARERDKEAYSRPAWMIFAVGVSQ